MSKPESAESKKLDEALTQNVELWVSELKAAGWKRIDSSIWADPSGVWYRGPYKAWCVMKGIECQTKK